LLPQLLHDVWQNDPFNLCRDIRSNIPLIHNKLSNHVYKVIQIQTLVLLYPIVVALCQVVCDIVNLATGPKLTSYPYLSMTLSYIIHCFWIFFIHCIPMLLKEVWSPRICCCPKMVLKYLSCISFREVYHQM
jgi:hypothetical protein